MGLPVVNHSSARRLVGSEVAHGEHDQYAAYGQGESDDEIGYFALLIDRKIPSTAQPTPRASTTAMVVREVRVYGIVMLETVQP